MAQIKVTAEMERMASMARLYCLFDKHIYDFDSRSLRVRCRRCWKTCEVTGA